MPLFLRESLVGETQVASRNRPNAANSVVLPVPGSTGPMLMSVAYSTQQPPGYAAVSGAPAYGRPVTSCQLEPPLTVRYTPPSPATHTLCAFGTFVSMR